MKQFEGILICTDLDGTLLDSHRVISKKNLEAIEYFQSEGGLFTFVTGRMPFFVQDIYQVVKPNAPFGCVNGSGIFDHRTQKYVWTNEMKHSVLELVEYVDQQIPDIGIQVNTFDKIYFCKENEAMEDFRKATQVPKLPGRYEDIQEPIAKIVFGDRKGENIERVKELLDAHPRAGEFDFVRSEYTLYEILSKGMNKGSVLMQLAKLLGIEPEKTVAIGDYNNDIPMLQAAGVGVAVANARPEVKAVADHVTVSNDEHAIAKVIEELECYCGRQEG